MSDKATIIIIVAAYFAIVGGFMLDWILELFEGE